MDWCHLLHHIRWPIRKTSSFLDIYPRDVGFLCHPDDPLSAMDPLRYESEGAGRVVFAPISLHNTTPGFRSPSVPLSYRVYVLPSYLHAKNLILMSWTVQVALTLSQYDRSQGQRIYIESPLLRLVHS